MEPEKIKLTKLLEEIGDVSFIKTDKQSIIDAISIMDIAALELILEEDLSYHDTTKSIFLQKLNDVFIEFKNEDTRLFPYGGICNSTECFNTNKKGVAFIGNISGRYLNLILEQNEDGSVYDIYDCSSFCTNEKIIDENKFELSIKVFEDEKTNFLGTFKYQDLNNNSIEAINELKIRSDSEITKEEIFQWILKYEEVYTAMNWKYMTYKNQNLFHNYYYQIRTISEFLKLENESFVAVTKFKKIDLNQEIVLLKWLTEFEHLYFKLYLLIFDLVTEESLQSGRLNLHKDFTTYFKLELLKNCLELERILETHYNEKLEMYTTQSKEDQENQISFDEDYETMSSLKYHLEKRGIL
jgi:hypothetical protein